MKAGVARLADVTQAVPGGYNDVVTTDPDLVSAAQRGDANAFAALLDRHTPVCVRYATRMLGNREDAEDVAQEAFVRAFRALGRYDGSVTFRTWLMTILVNRCRSALDARRRRDAWMIADDAMVARASVEPADDASAIRDAIARALTRLEPAQREAFLLKHVEQLSYDEMARVTGSGVSALKMRVQRACERLQVLLEEDRA